MKILIVDDEPRIRSALSGLARDEGYKVDECGSAEEGLAQLVRIEYDVLFLDVVLPGMDGLTALPKVRKTAPHTKVLMMSGQADIGMAVQATKTGAHNFFEKPLNPDQVVLTLRLIAEQLVLERKLVDLETRVDQEEEMVGSSREMQALRAAIAKAGPSDGRVLVFGENGTGKELVARAIHQQSLRKHNPFVSLNCAALPKDLVESELFGYEKGAFTGAVKRKPGRFETADAGTLFLDEVGDMAMETQAKLLRVLEEHEAVRLGGETPYSFDVRIIAATNKDLEKEIAAGRFREDLFYRLNVIPLNVPPLRERLEDILKLAHHFLRLICEKTGNGMKTWSGEALLDLQSYHWPGNIRELKNFVERLVIMSDGAVIDVESVRNALPGKAVEVKVAPTLPDDSLSLKEMLERHEKDLLLRGYHHAEGNVSKLARLLKVDRANLHRKLKAHGIK